MGWSGVEWSDGVPTSLMMDPFDRAGYTSKMLRDQHQHINRQNRGIILGRKMFVFDLKNAGSGNISNGLFLPAGLCRE